MKNIIVVFLFLSINYLIHPLIHYKNIYKVELISIERNHKKVLEYENLKDFIKDLNKSQILTTDVFFVICYEVNLYTTDNTIISFKTDGIIFYNEKDQYIYSSKKNLLEKYWNISEENACK
jgi:hypothetical protein